MQVIIDNWEILLPVLILILDVIAGFVPDNKLKYVGLVRRILKKK